MFKFTRCQVIAAYIVVGAALLGTGVLVVKSGVLRSSGGGEIKFIEPGASAPDSDGIAAEPAKISIHVAGKVNKPGLYELDTGSRVTDAIEAAGGAAANADLESINLAERLTDGQQVHIAAKGEITPPKRSVVRGGSSHRESTAKAGESRASSQPKKLTKPGEGTVNINTAGLGELQRLPGIGPAMGQRIIDYRTEHSRFQSVEELVEVRGIGSKTLEKMRPFVTL